MAAMTRHGYTAAQVRRGEEPLLAAGMPLMRRAAAGLAAEIRATLASRPIRGGDDTVRILMLVGSGNNGGDALFAAAELAASGIAVTAVATADGVHAEALEAATSAGVGMRRGVSADEIAGLSSTSDVIVDGILGTGSGAADRAALRGRARALVVALLPTLETPDRPAIVAVDLPSGVSPDDGAVPDSAVLTADVTVTFGAIKAGLLLPPGSRYAGRVVVVDIGLAPKLKGVVPAITVDA
ncbi:NAD(P)H-hydrate epimerase [Marisediminicola sp. LYQ85]|uniref:NAD(P)H-hydrate epimerase n=1 Tax=Marisediminicola sp. LYQ85 TaxID=3391062 RepID=UPI003983AD63